MRLQQSFTKGYLKHLSLKNSSPRVPSTCSTSTKNPLSLLCKEWWNWMTSVLLLKLMMWKNEERMDSGLAFMKSFLTFQFPPHCSLSCHRLAFSVLMTEFFVKLWSKVTDKKRIYVYTERKGCRGILRLQITNRYDITTRSIGDGIK